MQSSHSTGRFVVHVSTAVGEQSKQKLLPLLVRDVLALDEIVDECIAILKQEVWV